MLLALEAIFPIWVVCSCCNYCRCLWCWQHKCPRKKNMYNRKMPYDNHSPHRLPLTTQRMFCLHPNTRHSRMHPDVLCQEPAYSPLNGPSCYGWLVYKHMQNWIPNAMAKKHRFTVYSSNNRAWNSLLCRVCTLHPPPQSKNRKKAQQQTSKTHCRSVCENTWLFCVPCAELVTC